MCWFCLFFFNDTATTEIYTLSLHDALPILKDLRANDTVMFTLPTLGTGTSADGQSIVVADTTAITDIAGALSKRSEEHTSELQSRRDLVCRLLLEKKNYIYNPHTTASRPVP